MRAIILAAGKGTRLKEYTEDLPKGMLEFAGKSLIERQIATYRGAGISDISIVTGHAADKINFLGVEYFHNPDYDSTNMVETLWQARSKLKGELVVSYADIVFEERLLHAAMQDANPVGVVVDTAWREYWKQRYGDDQTDIESLSIDEEGNITELGREVKTSEGIDGRYVGLLHFSSQGIDAMVNFYEQARKANWNKPWGVSGNLFQKAYMTDLLQELVDQGIPVNAVAVQHGLLEFDTVEDYEKMSRMYEQASLDMLCTVR